MRCHLVILLVVLATAAQVLAAPPSTSLFFPSFIRGMLGAGTSAATQTVGMMSNGIQTVANITHRIGKAALDSKQLLVNAGFGASADAFNSTLSAANKFADMGTQLANATGMSAVAQLASLGASMIKLGTSMANAGGMMAINTAHQIATAKLNLTSAALATGTGLVNNMSNATASAVQTGIRTASNLTDSAMAAADQMISQGLGMVNSGMQMVVDASNSAAASLNSAGLAAQTTLHQKVGTPDQIAG